MRLIVIGLTMALAASAPLTAAAQAPVATPPLATGEVLLQLGAIGVETVPADLATMTLVISGQGETEAAARVEMTERYRRIVAAAREAGVPAAGIGQLESGRVSDMSTVAIPDAVNSMAMDANMAAEAPSGPSVYVSGTVTIRVTESARMDAVRSALESVSGSESGFVAAVYSLSDNRPARQAARNRALATVRAEAEAYAASLNMRVGRIVRISERTGVELLPQLFGDTALMRSVGGGPFSNRGSQITVPVAVGVDFVLVPR